MFRTSRPLTGAVVAFEWTRSSQSHVKLNISGSIIHLPHPNTPAVSCHTITRAHADSKRANWKLFPASASCSLTYFSPPLFYFFSKRACDFIVRWNESSQPPPPPCQPLKRTQVEEGKRSFRFFSSPSIQFEKSNVHEKQLSRSPGVALNYNPRLWILMEGRRWERDQGDRRGDWRRAGRGGGPEWRRAIRTWRLEKGHLCSCNSF